MDDNAFQTQIKRLATRFGNAAFSKPIQELIVDYCKDLDGAWFTRTVDYFLANKRSAPVANDFLELAIREKRRRQDEVDFNRQMIRDQSGPDCPYCDPNVPGMAWSDTMPRQVGRCICPDGQKYMAWMPEAYWLKGKFKDRG